MSRQRIASHFNVAVAALAVLIGALDAVSIAWAQRALARHSIHVLGPIWLRLEYNTGVSFSINQSAPTLTIIITSVLIVVVVVVGLRARGVLATIGFGLLIGGGLANVVDRLLSSRHAVTDYIAVSTFPVFNVADVAITAGFVVLAVSLLRGERLLAR